MGDERKPSCQDRLEISDRDFITGGVLEEEGVDRHPIGEDGQDVGVSRLLPFSSSAVGDLAQSVQHSSADGLALLNILFQEAFQ